MQPLPQSLSQYLAVVAVEKFIISVLHFVVISNATRVIRHATAFRVGGSSLFKVDSVCGKVCAKAQSSPAIVLSRPFDYTGCEYVIMTFPTVSSHVIH